MEPTDQENNRHAQDWEEEQEERDLLEAVMKMHPDIRPSKETIARAMDADPEWVDRVVKRLAAGSPLANLIASHAPTVAPETDNPRRNFRPKGTP